MGEKVFTVTAGGREARYRAARFVMTDDGDLLLYGPRDEASGLEVPAAAFLRGCWSSVHCECARVAEVPA